MDQFIREVQEEAENKNDVNNNKSDDFCSLHSSVCEVAKWGFVVGLTSLFAYGSYKICKFSHELHREHIARDPEFARYYGYYKQAELITKQHNSAYNPHNSHHIAKLAGQMMSEGKETDSFLDYD